MTKLPPPPPKSHQWATASYTPTRRRSTPRPLFIVAFIIGAVVVIGGLGITLTRNRPHDLSPAASSFYQMAAYLPAQAGLSIALSRDNLPNLQALINDLNPNVALWAHVLYQQMTERFIGIDLLSQAWLDGQIAVTWFPNSTDGNDRIGFILTAQINDREAAMTTLNSLIAAPNQPQSSGSASVYTFDTGLRAYVMDRIIYFTDANTVEFAALLSPQQTLQAIPGFAETLSLLSYEDYSWVGYIDLSSSLWELLGLADTLQTLGAIDTGPYFAIGFAQPDPNTTLLDFAQTPANASDTLSVVSTFNGELLKRIPMDSPLILQTVNPYRLYQHLRYSPFIQETIPAVDVIAARLNEVFNMIVGVDLENDLLAPLTGEAVLFVESPFDPSGSTQLSGGVVMASANPAITQQTFERMRTNLPANLQLLHSLFPDFPLDIRAESLDDVDTLVIELPSPSTIPILTGASGNGGEWLVIGTQTAVESILNFNNDETSGHFNLYQPYLLPNASMNIIIHLHALQPVLVGAPINDFIVVDSMYIGVTIWTEAATLADVRVVFKHFDS